MPDGIVIATDRIKDDIASIKQRLIQYRKKGVDTSVVDIRLSMLPSKIKMIEATRDGKDIQRATAILNLAKRDADELEQQYQQAINFKKPEEPDSAVEEIRYIIGQSRKMMKSDIKEAKAFYWRAYKGYITLKDEQKKKVITALNQLRLDLNKAYVAV